VWWAVLVISLALLFAFSNGFHDAANVVSTMIMTRAVSPRRALLIAAACELIAPLFLGGAVAKTIGEDIIRFPAYDPASILTSAAFLVAALVGAVLWNLITWFFGFPSSSSHALIGGMVGAGLIAYGPSKIIWGGLFYIAASLVISPLLGLIFGMLFLKMTLHIFRNATPKVNYFFNRMQIPSSVALAISHGSNDVQKSIGLIAMAFMLLGFSSSFQAPLWVIASCGTATALGTASGGWKIIKTMGSKIYRLRSVHAFGCHLRGSLSRWSGVHHPRCILEHHGRRSGSADLGGPVGSGEEYHPGLGYHHPCLRSDGGIKFLFHSKDFLLCSVRAGEKGVKDV